MDVCTEENVNTVYTKRLKKSIDIDQVKCVKCSPDNSYLLVHRLDFALHLVYVKTGQVYEVCKDVREFRWSIPGKGPSGSSVPHSISVLRNNGTVEVFEIKERILIAKESSPEENHREKVVSSFGSLKEETIKTLLLSKGEELTLKNPRLVCCKQGVSNEDDRVDNVTLLFDGYLLIVLSFSVLLSPDVVKWFEMVRHGPAVPFLLPQEAVVEVKTSEEMLFMLYEHGIVVVYNMSSWTFFGWIDIFLKSESIPENEAYSTCKRTRAKFLVIEQNMSAILVCDDRNNVIRVDLESYYHHFPRHLNKDESPANSVQAPSMESLSSSLSYKESATNQDGETEQYMCGDVVWKAEVLDISGEIAYAEAEAVNKALNQRIGHVVKPETLEGGIFLAPAPWSVFVKAPPWMEDFSTLALYCSSGSFVLWLEPKRRQNISDQSDVDHGVLCCYAEWKDDYFISLFVEKTFVASGGHPTKPLYLLTKNMIGLPVFGTTQNELVNKVITFENVAMAEKLCYLNGWDHFAVPVSALEAALKHQQLDTVAFYLKTKGKAFSTIATESESALTTRALSSLSPNSFSSKQLYSKPTQSEDLLEQITSVVNLLVTTIKATSKRKHSVHFSGQLLQMSFDYVNGLMQDAVNYIERDLGNESDRERIHRVLSYLTDKTMELRWILFRIPPFPADSKSDEGRYEALEGDAAVEQGSEIQEIIFKKWSEMDDKDVIADAIRSCHLPLAQLYFLSKGGDGYSSHDGSLRYVIDSGMNLVLEMLTKKDIGTASAMLRNMGEDVVQLLRNICLKTFDRPLRDYLIKQLESLGELTEEEISAVKFLKSLESIYDNQSFESILIRKSQDTGPKLFSDLGLLAKSFDPTSPGVEVSVVKTGSIAQQHHGSMVSRVSVGYCEVLLDWVVDWDQETRERILVEMLIHDEKVYEEKFWAVVSEKSCWHYLKAHSDVDRIVEWILTTAQSSTPVMYPFPRLTLEACSDLSECSGFLREAILDQLARNGLYSYQLLSNFPLLLRHLCRTGKLFAENHPMRDITHEHCQEVGVTVGQPGTVTSMKSFHREMLEYCSRHNLMNLLYYYLDFYRLCQTREECEELAPRHLVQQVDMLLKFRLAGLFPADHSVMAAMSFSNSCAALNTSNPSLINMLSNHRPIMAIATCLYAPVDLSQIMQPQAAKELDDIWQLDETLLRSALSGHPRLCSALFPRIASQLLSENPDITLYELLQGNCSFEISSLFTWQSTNILATRGGLSSDMPHFSQRALVEKFAHKETLTYVYFLKHGRPSFAFLTFMSKYQHRKYIPKSSISKATTKSYQLAVSHFTNNRIVYGCVAFLELLRVDTTFLRIDIGAARRILQHGTKEDLDCNTTEELKNVIVSKLLKCVKASQYIPNALITILENSTRNLISKEGLDRSSREAGQFWSLPVMFCRSHNMTLTPAFLIDCAKADKWLTFLSHVQAAQFPKKQVLNVIQHYFETNILKEHLRQAVVNIVTVDAKEARGSRRKGKSPEARRDVRSQYISRVIGVTKSPTSKSEATPKSKESPNLPPEKTESEHYLDFDIKGDFKTDEDDEDDEENDVKSSSEATSVNVTDLNPESSPDNLFDVLSLCNDTNEPWRALLAHSVTLRRPLFAVLAACYKDANLVGCICVWLCSVHKKEIIQSTLKNIADVQWHRWRLDDLLSLILNISKSGAGLSHNLARAFYLFDPGSLLLPLMRFYEAFSVHMDFEAAGNQLSYFVLHHKFILVNDDAQSPMVVGDVRWCERVATGVVQNMLRSCQTMHSQVHLFRLLCHGKFGNGFSVQVPDYNTLYRISHVLEEGAVFAQCVDLIGDEAETDRILEELLQHQKFTEAQEYAKLASIPLDKVSLLQIIQKKKNIQASRLWESERERIAFWEGCDQYLEEQGCATAGQFFEDEASSSSLSTREKAKLLCLAFNCYNRRQDTAGAATKSPADLAELESRMWLCIINDRIECARDGKSTTSLQGFTCCGADLNLLQEQHLKIEGNFSHVSDDKVQKVLKDIIGELLDDGHITQARRLAVLFGISTTDLDIVLNCIFLAQEILSPDSLDEDIKASLTPQEKPTLSNSLKFTGSFFENLSLSQLSIDDNKSNEDVLSSWSMVGDNLTTMENLSSSCRSGKICCSRVIVAYKICQTLGLAFDNVVCTSPFDLLCSVLGSSFDYRYQLAAQYIKSFNLDSAKVAHFVAKSIFTSLKVYTGSEIQEEKVFIFNPASREDTKNVISLCEDKLILGGLLFDEALSLAKRRKTVTPSSSALTMEVELLICAHHCQTFACNTEGISSILKLAQLCTQTLADANEYQLMVRLLSGIGRFAEMTYVFQTLMDHHHFELLGKKGLENEKKLKMALLNYLDKYYLEDTDKHLLVAYRFSMHREVAMSLKASADAQVHKLVERGLSATNEVRTQLIAIARSYTYAMENFKEEGCLLKALECTKKHRLVKLQENLLPTGMVVLDLNDKTLSEFLAKYNNFFEAYIVADAYNKRSLDTWVEPVFNHVILKGDFKYFNELCSVFPVSKALLSELVLRYRSELQRNSSAIACMKTILRGEKDILCRYDIAVQLGYRDEVESIRNSEAGAFVRDSRP